MGNLKIEYLQISDLIPYANNPRINDNAVDAVAASIKEFGFKNPIVIDNCNVIIAGHTRLKAAEKLGLKTVPIIRADDLTEQQAQAFRLADNKTAELAEWDLDSLEQELDELSQDFDMTDFGFELLNFDDDDTEITEDEVPEEVETRCKLGDVWKLGSHRLICGDSTDPTVIDRLMDGVKADMVFTDPPYNMQMTGGCIGVCANMRKVEKDIESISSFDPKPFLEIIPAIFDKNMNTYIFCNKDLVVDYLNWGKENGYSYNILVWKKPNSIPVGDSHRPDLEYLLLFRKNAIWNNGLEGVNYSRCLEYSRVKKSDTTGNHPTVKPIELIGNEIKISSKVNSIVVDFFGGSGSTLIACEQLNRKCYMCELDEHYCDVIIQRWENLTKEKAEKQ